MTAMRGDRGAGLGEQLGGGAQRAAGGQHVVDEQHPLAVEHADRDLDLGRAVLEVVGAAQRRRRQLAGLAHRHQAAAELAGQRAGDQEAARLDPGDEVDPSPARRREARR